MQTKPHPKLTLALWLAAAAWCGTLFFLSGQSGAESSALSRFVTQLLLRILPNIRLRPAQLEPILRKLAHFASFATEGALLCAALTASLSNLKPACALATLACAILAALNEFHQSFIDGRSCEFRDMLIDAAGGLTGALFAALLLWLGHRIARRAARRRGNVII